METQFALTSIDKNTVTYDLGGGPSAAESSFYAAGYGDFIAIEHHTMKYFGTRQVPVSGVTVNGVTFTTDTDAVAAINALDISFMQDLGSLDIHTDIKSSDRPTITMPDPEDPSSTVTKEIATLGDIPAPSPTVDLDVSAMFTANVELAHFAARMVQYPGKLPFIRIFCEDTSGADTTLTLTAALGFGSLIDHTAERAIAQHYIDTDGSVAHDTITITPETPTKQSVITVPSTLHEFNITYWVGATEDTPTSYWTDTAGEVHWFTAANTPMSSFASSGGSTRVIEGVSVSANTIARIHFGEDYSGVTEIPRGAFWGMTALVAIDLPTTIATIREYAFANCRNIVAIALPDDIVEMEQAIFSGCSKLSSVNIPDGITVIPPYLFSGCGQLADVSIPDSITTIGASAFQSCGSLTNIILPASLSELGNRTFANCYTVTDIYFGSIDASGPGFNLSAFDGMRSSGRRHHATQALANTANRFYVVGGWTEVINETPASS